jgi:hypothetical protein
VPARPQPQQDGSAKVAGLDDSAFSDDFCRFLQSSVPSVDAAELLLVLAGEPARWWLAPELIAKLGPASTLSEADALRYLEQFEAGALLSTRPDRRVQYHPAHDALAGHVRMLAQAYNERPVTLFRVIYALRDLKIQSFADAFRVRRS